MCVPVSMEMAACCVMSLHDSSRSRVKAAGMDGCSRYSTEMSELRRMSGRHRIDFVPRATITGSPTHTHTHINA